MLNDSNYLRVLPLSRIPPDLWTTNLLRLPSDLNASYVSHLTQLGLIDKSVDTSVKEVHGGQSESETHEHFACRFAVSAGRTEYSTLGPHADFSLISDAFLTTFSTGTVGLLDIPCGTGAMSAALVSTLTHLRRLSVIPKLPLTICICAGDCSEEALRIFNSLFEDLIEPAAREGIIVSRTTKPWDATKSNSTASLVDDWFFVAQTASEYFVAVSNFSGALSSQNRFAEFKPCFEHILARLHNKRSTVIWIEPASKSARVGLFSWITDFISSRISWFSHRLTEGGSVPTSDYEIEHPLNAKRFRTNIVVQQFERT